MSTLPDPEDVTTKQAAEILLAQGWQVYPDALPYGDFFYIPAPEGYWNFAVASTAYREFWRIEHQRLTQRAPDSLKAAQFCRPEYRQLELGLSAMSG